LYTKGACEELGCTSKIKSFFGESIDRESEGAGCRWGGTEGREVEKHEKDGANLEEQNDIQWTVRERSNEAGRGVCGRGEGGVCGREEGEGRESERERKGGKEGWRGEGKESMSEKAKKSKDKVWDMKWVGTDEEKGE
jgi:hypothetical protein